MGAEQAMEYWRSCDDFEMLLILEDGGIWLTEGLEDLFSLNAGESGREVVVIRHEM